MASRTLSNAGAVVDAAIAVGMFAHEMERGQAKLVSARITRLFVIKVDRLLFHIFDFSLTVANPGDFFIKARVMLIDSLLLSPHIFQDEGLDYAERHFWIGLENFQNYQRR